MIQDAIDKILEVLADDVTGIGQVYGYYPLDAVKTLTLAKSAMAEDGSINLCIVTRPTAEREEDGDNVTSYRHVLLIETRKTFTGSISQRAHDATIDGILSAFDDDTLAGTVHAVYSMRLTQNEPQIFINTWLVHYGRIEVLVEAS